MIIPTISTPGTTLSRQTTGSQKQAKAAPGSRHNATKKSLPRTPASTPVVRGYRPDRNRAIAYSERTPYGRIVHIRFPKNASLVMVDAANDSATTSGASSPTMINLNDALVDGNTNSGAHITDVINAHLFRSFHCNRRNSDPLDVADASEFEVPPSSGAWRPLTRSESGNNLLLNLDTEIQEPDTNAFLDLDAYD